jgi:hypothetical protein
MLIGGYVIIELLGLPVDIFNFLMVKSDNSIGIAQGLTAPILNGVYMVINFIIMIIAASYLIAPQILSGDFSNFSSQMLLFTGVNLPGFVLLFTQVNALLYIYEANESKDLITDVIFA